MTTGRIGDLKAEFKPGLDNLIAGIIIGLLLFLSGSGLLWVATNGVIDSGGRLPVMADRGMCWVFVIIFLVLGFGLCFGGALLIRWIRSLFSFRVFVGVNGLLVSEKKTERFIGWDDIDTVRETHLYERPPILKGPAIYLLPKMMSKSFVIRMKQDDPFEFDGNTIKELVKLADLIKLETDRRKIVWHIVEHHD